MTPARKRRKRERLQVWGRRGERRCLLLRERVRGGERYVVERYVRGAPVRRVFPTEAEGRAFATSWFEGAPAAVAASLTVRELFDRYFRTEAARKKWRGATLLNYGGHRKRVEEVLLPDMPADRITPAHLDHIWATLTASGMAETQVAQKVNLLKRAVAWGYIRDYVGHNKLAAWTAPEVEHKRIPEFTPADTDRILAQWDYRSGWEWRPWAVTMIAQSHGIRANALMHLQWADVDLVGGTITLRKERDKTKREWARPLTWDAYAALLTARWHQERLGKPRTWVFYGKGDAPYTYGAYHAALRKAEAAAGVEHVRYRAAHGFRRKAINDARELTGDPALALLWVNDTDLRQARSYVRERPEEFDRIAGATIPATVPRAAAKGGKSL